jgi:hypothetical protein
MANSRPSRSRRSKGRQGKQRRDYETYHSWLGAGAVTIGLADSTSDGPPSSDTGNTAAADPAPNTPADTSPATGSDSDSTTTSPTDKSPTSTVSAQTTTITADVKDDEDKEDLAAVSDKSRVAIYSIRLAMAVAWLRNVYVAVISKVRNGSSSRRLPSQASRIRCRRIQLP